MTTQHTRPTRNTDADGSVRYTGYDPETGRSHFSVNLGLWAEGKLPPIPAAQLMDAAPGLLAALEVAADALEVAGTAMNKGNVPGSITMFKHSDLARAAIKGAKEETK